MTALQMLYEFEIGYELANSFSRNYSEKEVSTLLTQAQNQIVLEVLDSDYTELKDILINNLKENTDDTIGASNLFPNSYEFSLPTDCLKVLHDRVDIELKTTSIFYNISVDHLIEDVPTITITEDYYNLNIDNPDKKPYEKLVWRLLSPSKLIFIGNSTYDIVNCKCIYIKRPSPIIIQWSNYTTSDGKIDNEDWEDYKTSSLDCILEEVFHRKIVDRAILLAIVPTGDNEKLQTKLSIT